jgi:sec-independent protein translocase protein TatB
MFDVGFAELFLLSLIGLLVLGPERLPGVARTVGGFVRKARASWTSLRSTIEMELAEADISEPIKQANEEFKKIGKGLTDIPEYVAEELNSILPESAEPGSSTKAVDVKTTADDQQDAGNSKNDNV